MAEAALPDTVPAFKETKRLLRRKHKALMKGQAGVAAAQPITDQLADLGRRTSREFPLEAAEVNALFGDMGERLSALYAAENQALAELKAAL